MPGIHLSMVAHWAWGRFGAMVTAAFTTLGCKVNQYETQRILESFEEAGFAIVPFTDRADVYVINTCSVTQAGESKSRQTARRAAKQNPDAKVVVTGCAGEMAKRRGEDFPAADLVVPNRDKLLTLDYLFSEFPEFGDRAAREPRPADQARPAGRTRATVKLQNGCNIFCSYCSIPYTRPHQFSRPWEEVVEEVRKLANRGYLEVVLTGVLIGDYGPRDGSGGPDLPDLIEKLAATIGLERIRISSIELTQVTPKLLDLMRRERKICPHLHIPLQAGDDRVLRDMNRPYLRQDYIDLCLAAKAMIPGVGLTTDIMVGFPSEDEEGFEKTLDVARQVGYLSAHVFRYSPRPGTPAEKMGDPVHGDIKAERSKRLTELVTETGTEFRRQFLGREMRVLAEGPVPGGGLLRGFTDNYIEVRFPGPQSICGQLVTVRLDELHMSCVAGEVVSETALRLPLLEERV